MKKILLSESRRRCVSLIKRSSDVMLIYNRRRLYLFFFSFFSFGRTFFPAKPRFLSDVSPFPIFFQDAPLISTSIRRSKDRLTLTIIASRVPRVQVAMKALVVEGTLFVF